MLRRLLLPALIFAAVLGVFAFGNSHHALAAPRDLRDFTLYNDSSYVTIVHIYVSPSDVDSWQEDVLGQDVLVPGNYVNIHFSPNDGSDTCVYDIRIDGDDGSTTYDWGVDLCSTTAVHFTD